ncbi:MAG TPA: YciI family protein [Thermoanaerobaculia bacterium]|nr:YciI family protein [Thermoanaerobaculia bacterium]
MQYLLLLYAKESDWVTRSEAERGQIFQEYVSFSNRIHANGNYVGGNALQPVETATTVRVRNGKTMTTDGPFAETKEQLGGYFLVEAKNLDEAIAIANGIPAARYGSVEIRPIMPTPKVGG